MDNRAERWHAVSSAACFKGIDSVSSGMGVLLDNLMKAFEQIRCANQCDIRPWQMHCQGTSGLLEVMEKGYHRLRLACLPGGAKPLRPRPHLALDIRRINLARIRQDGPLPFFLGLPTRRHRELLRRAHPL